MAMRSSRASHRRWGAPNWRGRTLCHPHTSHAASIRDELDPLSSAWTATLTVDEVDALMTEYSIPAAASIARPILLARIRIFRRARRSSRSKRSSAGGSRCRTPFPNSRKTPSTTGRPPLPRPGQTMPRSYANGSGWMAAELARPPGCGGVIRDGTALASRQIRRGRFRGATPAGQRPTAVDTSMWSPLSSPRGSPLVAGQREAAAKRQQPALAEAARG